MRILVRLGMLLCFAAGLAGCNTLRAEKELSQVTDEEPYAGFGSKKNKESERKVKPAEAINDDTNVEKAIGILVERLQSPDRGLSVPAEDELRYWASKQGVPEIIVRKVRLLLQNPKIEVRAPALRLTIAIGKKESNGDLIEVLADDEYGMRATAFKALKARTGRDHGFNPAGGDLARAKSLQAWRKWWQDEQELSAEKPAEKSEAGVAENPKKQKSAAPESPRAAEEGKASLPPEVLLPPPKDTAPQ